jgi:hypothetical protein
VKLPRRQGWERPLPAAALTAGGMGAATGGAGGGLASSAFCKLNHCGQVGALPPPPRAHFEKPKGSPSCTRSTLASPCREPMCCRNSPHELMIAMQSTWRLRIRCLVHDP